MTDTFAPWEPNPAEPGGTFRRLRGSIVAPLAYAGPHSWSVYAGMLHTHPSDIGVDLVTLAANQAAADNALRDRWPGCILEAPHE